MSQTGQLSQKLEDLEDFDLAKYLQNNAPEAQQNRQYVGGVISLYLKIADIDVENLLSLSRLKANAVKGPCAPSQVLCNNTKKYRR